MYGKCNDCKEDLVKYYFVDNGRLAEKFICRKCDEDVSPPYIPLRGLDDGLDEERTIEY